MKMQIILIVAAILLVCFVFRNQLFSDKTAENSSRPPDSQLPSVPQDNDKIILVKNVKHEDIKNALIKFCNIYNQKDFAALPRLWQLSPETFVITFPYDVDFVTYCFAINFMKYPVDIKWNAMVRAWATAKAGDDWITDKSANKPVMLFLADDDKEYDNVFLTTNDNIGYKLGFAMGQEKQLLSTPKEKYIAPTVNLAELSNKQFEDFK